MVLALIAGVLLMHALPPMPAGSTHSMTTAAATITTHPVPESTSAQVAVNTDLAAAADTVAHVMNHPCLAVLTAALAVLLLVGVVVAGRGDREPRRPGAGMSVGRDPPWTAPTLAGLSILRV